MQYQEKMFNLSLEPNKLLGVQMYLFAILAPLSVTKWNKIVLVLLFLSALITFFYYITISKKLTFDKYSFGVILIFLSVFFVSLFSILINRDYLVADYLKSVVIGRMFTLITLTLNLLLFTVWLAIADERCVKRILKFGLFTAFTFILLGYWQVIGKLIGIPFFVDTRDWMHGVPAALRSIFPSRVTSIAEEPNFLSPILMECMLLIALLVEKKAIRLTMLGMTVIIVVLSFSGGAYVNFALICTFVFSLIALKTVLTGKTRISHFFVLLLVFCLLLVLMYLGTLLLDFIYFKLQHEATGGSSRSQFMVSFTSLLARSNLVQLIFGHGLGTMSVLDSFGMRSEDYLFRITNNYTLDMFWEGGVIGVGLILLFYFKLIYPGLKYGFKNNAYLIGAVMSFHFIVTSTYRSEYLSTHFLWVILMIFSIYKLAEFQSNNVNN
ncbi:hypothetical protein FC650_00775 [Vibrio natriegens]|nr:hypothetical protein [Vibrio natriegens]